MVTKKVKCPSCENRMTITGNLGEKTYLTCPQCGNKGVFIFPGEKQSSNELSESNSIQVARLTKIYNKFKAVDDVSFSVKRGEIFGFLGPNGAGKTTTIKAMLDLIHANTGTIIIYGLDMKTHGKEAKKYIGYLPEKVAFYSNLTALQNLNFYAEMKHVPKEECTTLLQEMGLGDVGKKRVGAFSKGMVQRLGMARAILGNPPILILDEPSGGLDPRGVVLIRDKILAMKKNGTTVFISSHILSELQEICDRVCIINKGRLVAQDTVVELSKKLNIKPHITILVEVMTPAIENAIKAFLGIEILNIQGNSIEIICDSAMKAKIILAISNVGGNIINIQTKEPSLEEVFMRYTEA